MSNALDFLLNRRGRKRADFTDWIARAYLLVALVVMLGPVLWLVVSAFKTPEGISAFPPTFLPYAAQTASIEGYDRPLPLYVLTEDDGRQRTVAVVRRIGLIYTMVDPAAPAEEFRITRPDVEPLREVSFAISNFVEPLQRFDFPTYFRNSVVITSIATVITLILNSLAAFALAKYQFKGRAFFIGAVLAVLMVPQTVLLVPLYLVVSQLGMVNSIWGVILPTVATPTGIFILRQYMLTIPDELIEAARMDKASEWRIYWKIVMPLSTPALAVLGILTVVAQWNMFLWPLIVLQDSQSYTMQIGLANFSGDTNVQWNYLLAMTLVTLLPVTIAFALLQKHIVTGVATTGLK